MPGTRLAIALTLAVLPAELGRAQAEADDQQAPEVTIGRPGSEQDPLAGRVPVLSVEPVRAAPVNQVQGIQGVPALTVQVDPRSLGVAPGEPLPRLRREGEAVRRRDGQLMPTNERGYAVFILEADPESGDDQPVAMVLAPCIALESMEAMVEAQGDDLRFTITGEVHAYRGVNFLLPTAQPIPWLVDQQENEDEIVSDQGEDAGDAAQAQSEDTTEDTTEDATDEPEDEDGPGSRAPSADEVLNQLLQQRIEPPVENGLNASSGSGGAGVYEGQDIINEALVGLDPDQPMAELKPEGDFIIARTGRLVRSGNGTHALFVLDADSQAAPEPPLIMQACRLLEQMESIVMEQGDDVPFVITGQVYVYRGANYLLPTIVRREFDRGNFE